MREGGGGGRLDVAVVVVCDWGRGVLVSCIAVVVCPETLALLRWEIGVWGVVVVAAMLMSLVMVMVMV